jgi:antitoxin (DNA-binding transcriptional repressor) of toxin-antitoxin stability system
LVVSAHYNTKFDRKDVLSFLYAPLYNQKLTMKQNSNPIDETAAALVRVASYLGRPQRFMAIADARAELRRTLTLAAKGSVVLTNHGEPAAAVVPFTTLADMRRALLHLLVAERVATFTHSQDRLKSRRGETEPSTEEDMEALVGEAVRRARRPRRKSARKVSRG